MRSLAKLLPDVTARRIRDSLNSVLLSSNKDTDILQTLKDKLRKQFKPVVARTQDVTGKDLIQLWDYQ